MEPEDLKAHLDEMINKLNCETSQDFEGLSPNRCIICFTILLELKVR